MTANSEKQPSIAEEPGMVRRVAKSLLPAGLREHFLACKDLEPTARRWYLRLLVLRAVGRRKSSVSPRETPGRVMFVCYGNIIRSAFAEVLLRSELERLGVAGIEIISSGTDARTGREADRRAIAVAPEFGLSLERHRATRVTAELMEASDLVFAMDHSNEAKLAARFPHALEKILLLAPAKGEAGPLPVPDPYTADVEAVRACYRVLRGRISHLAEKLARSHERASAYSGNAPR